MTPYRTRIEFLVTMLILLTALALLIATCDSANAQCRTCNRVVQRQVVTSQYVQPAVKYFVGAPLRQQAVRTYAMQTDPDWSEYQQFKAWKAGRASAQPQTEKPCESGKIEVQRQTAPSAIQQHCAKCHTGEEPKGGLWLDGSVDLYSPEAADKRDAIVRMIWQGKMPHKKPLDDAGVGAILDELYAKSDELSE